MSQLEKIKGRNPVNKTTAQVLARGEHYNPKVKITCAHWESQPPLIPVTAGEDMTGRQVGRMVVVGKYAAGTWAVRCNCGHYETRKTRAIKNPQNFGDRCVLCRHMASVKHQYAWIKTGQSIDRRLL